MSGPGVTPERLARAVLKQRERVASMASDENVDDQTYEAEKAKLDALEDEFANLEDWHTDAEYEEALQKYGASEPPAVAKGERAPAQTAPEVPAPKVFARQAGAALTSDFGDEISAFLGTLGGGGDDTGIPREYAAGSAYEDMRRQLERETEEGVKQHRVAALLGRGVGSGLQAVLPGAATARLAKGAQLGRAAATAAGWAGGAGSQVLSSALSEAGRAAPGERLSAAAEGASEEILRPDVFNPVLLGGVAPIVGTARHVKGAAKAAERAKSMDELADYSRLSAAGARDYQLSNLRESFGEDYVRGLAQDMEARGWHLKGSGPGGLSSARDIGRVAEKELERAGGGLKAVHQEAAALGIEAPFDATIKHLADKEAKLLRIAKTTEDPTFYSRANRVRGMRERMQKPVYDPGSPGVDESIMAEVVETPTQPRAPQVPGRVIDMEQTGEMLAERGKSLARAERDAIEPRAERAAERPTEYRAVAGRGEVYVPSGYRPEGTRPRSPRTWNDLVDARRAYDDIAHEALKANKGERAAFAREMASHYRQVILDAAENASPELKAKLVQANRDYEVARYAKEMSDQMATRVRVPHEMGARDAIENVVPAIYGGPIGMLGGIRRLLGRRSADVEREFGLDRLSRKSRKQAQELREYSSKPPVRPVAGAVGGATAAAIRREIERQRAQENVP